MIEELTKKGALKAPKSLKKRTKKSKPWGQVLREYLYAPPAEYVDPPPKKPNPRLAWETALLLGAFLFGCFLGMPWE